MGISAAIVDEKGNVLQAVPDAGSWLLDMVQAEGKRIRYLRGLDEYGDTVFNKFQMEDLMEDLSYLRSKTTNPSHVEALESIARLAQLVKQWTHTYLKFIGD